MTDVTELRGTCEIMQPKFLILQMRKRDLADAFPILPSTQEQRQPILKIYPSATSHQKC